MALTVGGVAVDLTANSAQIIAEMNKAARAVVVASNQMQGSTSRWASGFNNAERRINASVGGIGRSLRSIQGLVAAFGVGLGAREVIRYADAWQQANAQLRLVSSTAEQAASVQERLFEISQQLGVGVDALNTIYVRTARNAESLGVSTQDIIQATEALGAAIRISGTSAQEAQNALIQLSQSFASGVLRGDELRSVAEQMPVVLDAIASATGRTRQEIINFARENGIAADIVIESLVRQRDAFTAQAEIVGGTVEQAMTRVTNAVQRASGTAGRGGAFQPLIDGLNALAETLESSRIAEGIANISAQFVQFVDTSIREVYKIGAVAEAVFEGQFGRALDIITGKLDIFGAKVQRTAAQINALYPPAAALAAVVDAPAAAAPLELRGAPSVAGGSTASGAGVTGPAFGPPRPPVAFDPSRFRISAPPTFGPPTPDAGVLDEFARGEAIKNMRIEMEALNASTEAFSATLGQSIAAFAVGDTTFAQFAQSVLRNMIAMAAQAAITAALGAAVRSAFGDASAGPSTAATATTVLGTLTGLLGGIGARATGGPVSAGSPYMVGERGPELFVPSRAGQIVPNDALGGGGMTVNLDLRGAQRGSAAEWRQMLRQPGFAREMAHGLAPVFAGDPGLRKAMGRR